MKIELKDTQMLDLLHVLRSQYMSTKLYFEEAKDEKDKIGVTGPEEIKEMYNAILKQCKEEFPMLEYIK